MNTNENTECRFCGIENWQSSKPINENGLCGYCQDKKDQSDKTVYDELKRVYRKPFLSTQMSNNIRKELRERFGKEIF